MRAGLLVEQCQLCCYCTGSIAAGNFHIEHFRPRENFESLTYTWANLLASCEGGGKDVVDTRRHCGHEKGNWFEEGVTVDPSRGRLESLFRFPLDGRIEVSKRLEGARYTAVESTIEKLNLNAPSLKRRRAAILEKAGADAEAMDRATWRAMYLEAHGGVLQEFWPSLSYNYELHWSHKF